MAVFFGTHENKVDRKGRVSVPAPFRQALAASSYTGIVVRPSPRHQAIEGSDLEFMMALNESAQHNDIYSEEHDDLGFMLFAESFQLPFDPEGRVILPAELLEAPGSATRPPSSAWAPLSRSGSPRRSPPSRPPRGNGPRPTASVSL